MANSPSEIIKEYIVRVEGLDFPIRARITKSLKGNDSHLFVGDLSHYCKQFEEAATVYTPSLVRQDLMSIEHLIINYLENFTLIDIFENKSY